MVNNLSTEIIGNQQLRPLNNTYYGYLYETTNTVNGKNMLVFIKEVNWILTDETRHILSQKCVGCKGYIWITNKKDHEILVTKEQLKDYPGYVRGRLRNRQKKVKFND